MVSGTISLFLSKCFSPFPHGTGSLSVSQEYLALPDGPGRFAQDYSCPALLRIPLCHLVLRIRGYHPLWHSFPGDSPHTQCTTARSYNPQRCVATTLVWAIPRSLATTGGIINLFSFPRGTKMFQFPRFASPLSSDTHVLRGWVVPFGNPRVKGYLHLTAAYRSLSRPSSPL